MNKCKCLQYSWTSRQNIPGWSSSFGKILRCAYNGLFTIPRGPGKLMNGSDTTDAGRSHDNNNMANIVHPEYIHITHIHNIYNNFFLQLLSNYLKISFYSRKYAISCHWIIHSTDLNKTVINSATKQVTHWHIQLIGSKQWFIQNENYCVLIGDVVCKWFYCGFVWKLQILCL